MVGDRTGSHVVLTLSTEEALVLFDWVSRYNAEEQRNFQDQAEERVLWDLEAMLESQLVEPLSDGYERALEGARACVRDTTARHLASECPPR